MFVQAVLLQEEPILESVNLQDVTGPINVSCRPTFRKATQTEDSDCTYLFHNIHGTAKNPQWKHNKETSNMFVLSAAIKDMRPRTGWIYTLSKRNLTKMKIVEKMEKSTSRINNHVTTVVVPKPLFCLLLSERTIWRTLPNKHFPSRPAITEVDCTICRWLVSASTPIRPLLWLELTNGTRHFVMAYFYLDGNVTGSCRNLPNNLAMLFPLPECNVRNAERIFITSDTWKFY
jgi:hypothetical protein